LWVLKERNNDIQQNICDIVGAGADATNIENYFDLYLLKGVNP